MFQTTSAERASKQATAHQLTALKVARPALWNAHYRTDRAKLEQLAIQFDNDPSSVPLLVTTDATPLTTTEVMLGDLAAVQRASLEVQQGIRTRLTFFVVLAIVAMLVSFISALAHA